MKLTLILLSACVAVALGATSLDVMPPAKPNTCLSKNPLIGEMKVGEEKRLPKRCEVVYCREQGMIGLKTCGSYEVEPPCYEQAGDLDAPYPDCCSTVYC